MVVHDGDDDDVREGEDETTPTDVPDATDEPSDAPTEVVPVTDAPDEDAPVEDAPVEDAPVEDAPDEDAPDEDVPEAAAPEPEPEPEPAPEPIVSEPTLSSAVPIASSSTSTSQPGSKRPLIIVLAVLALIGLGVGGWFLYDDHRDDKLRKEQAAKRERASDAYEKELRPLSKQFSAVLSDVGESATDFEDGDASYENAADAMKTAKKDLRKLRTELLLVTPPKHLEGANDALLEAEDLAEDMVTHYADYVANHLDGITAQNTYDDYLEYNEENDIDGPTPEDEAMLEESETAFGLADEDFDQYLEFRDSLESTLVAFEKRSDGMFKLSGLVDGLPSESGEGEDSDDSDTEDVLA